MLELLDMVLARVEELTVGEEWDDSATSSGQTGLRRYRGGLPPKASAEMSENKHPFVVARVLKGAENVSQGRIIIRILGGLHTHGTVDDGLVAIDRLLIILLRISEGRNFFPYTLEENVTWQQGDQKDGLQPHPKYYLTMDLEFTREAVMNNY